MKLIEVTVHKYKSFESDQTFQVQDDVTILVGMNESGKTSALEAIAKTNYFQQDKKFKFNTTHDYPRRQKKSMDKSGKVEAAITCTYTLSDSLKNSINKRVGENVFTLNELVVTTKYNNIGYWNNMHADLTVFIKGKTKELGISSKVLNDKLLNIKNDVELDDLISGYKDKGIKDGLTKLKPFFNNTWEWDNPIKEFIARTMLKPALPKFLYYDEYYSLPSRIVIERLEEEDLEEEEFKTAKALLELADLNPSDILEASDFEDYIAELEATEAIISDELFKYWSTNKNLSIEFKIEAKEVKVKRPISNHYNQEEIIDVNIVEHIFRYQSKESKKQSFFTSSKSEVKGLTGFSHF